MLLATVENVREEVRQTWFPRTNVEEAVHVLSQVCGV